MTTHPGNRTSSIITFCAIALGITGTSFGAYSAFKAPAARTETSAKPATHALPLSASKPADSVTDKLDLPTQPPTPKLEPEPAADEESKKLALRVDPPAPPPPPAKPKLLKATEAQRAELIAAVERADRAETLALRKLDPAALNATHSGKALALLRGSVEQLQSRGEYMATEYAGSTVDSVLLTPDGLKAQLHTTEIWESSWYDRESNVCKAHIHKRRLPQTIFLRRSAQGWKIDDVKHDKSETPQFVRCHH